MPSSQTLARSVSRVLLLRQSKNSARSVSSLDRYRLIHSFFTQPVSPLVPQILSPSPIARRIDTRMLSRAFHDSRLLRADELKNSNTHAKHESTPEKPKPPGDSGPPPNLDNYPRFFRRLAQNLPHVRRPTRDDFLDAASGVWERMRVRYRWFFIRAFRKFNADDISALVTWFLMSQGLWILIGTTTFFSVIFAIANSLRLQATVARAISDYLTSETGVTIVFESAIVPKWKDSRISFRNVYITRRPPASASASHSSDAAHRAALGYDVSNHPANHRIGEDEDENLEEPEYSEEDIKWSMFDLNVDSIDVTLSLWRWLDGKGLVKDAVVKGVRGVLDRRLVEWSADLDPASFRHVHQPGDFELDSLTLEDMLVTVYQPGGFRPYTFSIFRADVGQLRKQWFFYDFMKAVGVVGQFDNCLFSLHRPQSIGRTNEQDAKDGGWATMSRFRIDGVNIDHVQTMTTEEGPISWITSGKLDAVLDIKFPREGGEADALNAILDVLTTTAAAVVSDRIPGQRALAKPPLTAPEDDAKGMGDGEKGPQILVDIDLRFRDLKAAVPMWTNELTYSSAALVRPIVAFMNANRTLVPIHCRVIKDLHEFDGAWTMWETGLMDDISLKVYDALAYHVTQANFNHRIKTVSLWSLQMTASAVLSALRNMVDPVAVQLREMYQDATGDLKPMLAAA